jgi:dihydrofolate reductase
MGKIVVSENVTLDGVVQDPAGAEGFGRGGWVGRVGERGREEAPKVLLDEALRAEAQLFGRRTYEFLATRWPSRTGDWNNSTVLAGDVMQEVSKLKQDLDGEVVVAGSIRLVRTLMENDLVDELRPKLLELGRTRTKQDELEHAAERQLPERQEQEQLLGISGTGARLYGRHARSRRRTELTHPSG